MVVGMSNAVAALEPVDTQKRKRKQCKPAERSAKIKGLNWYSMIRKELFKAPMVMETIPVRRRTGGNYGID
jgi:hypothetical protein